jgi:bacteriorhodopsin
MILDDDTTSDRLFGSFVFLVFFCALLRFFLFLFVFLLLFVLVLLSNRRCFYRNRLAIIGFQFLLFFALPGLTVSNVRFTWALGRLSRLLDFKYFFETAG